MWIEILYGNTVGRSDYVRNMDMRCMEKDRGLYHGKSRKFHGEFEAGIGFGKSTDEAL